MVRIALGSISLGLAVMIVSIATVTGFQQEIRNKVSGFSGHILINSLSSNVSHESNPIEREPDFLTKLQKLSGIKYFQVFATKPGIIRSENLLEGIIFKGVDRNFNSEFFQKHIVSGKVPVAGDTTASQEILVSEWLSNRLNLKTGSVCDLYFTSNNNLRPRRLTVAGIYNTGLFELDKQLVIGDLIHLQKINGWNDNQCGGIEVYLHKFREIETITDNILDVIGYRYNATSIRQRYLQIFQWLDLLDLNVYVIIALMILLAAINMITTLLIIIIEKTTLIGIMKSLGSRDYSIRKIFLYNAGILISRGLLWGNLFGLGICFLQYYTGFVKLNPESYYVSVVPISINWLYVIFLNAGTIILCLAMLIIPSHLITRITPVKAIKVD
jgi:lipoprotein-releasing system permease protein